MADDVIEQTYVPLGTLMSQDLWPADYFGSADFEFLNFIAYVDGDIFDDDDATRIALDLQVVAEVAFDFPFGFSLFFGAGSVRALISGDETGFEAWIDVEVVGLRLPRDLFVPVIVDSSSGKLTADPDPDNFVEIAVPFGLNYNNLEDQNDFSLALPAENATPLNLPQCMLGDTGIVISANDIIVRLSDSQDLPPGATDAGVGPGWRGLFIGEAEVILREGLSDTVPNTTFKCQNCFIGTGGFTGNLTDQSPVVVGSLFGMDFSYESLSIDIVQNALTKFELKGKLKVPFFDQELEVTIGIDTVGKISVTATNLPVPLSRDNLFKLSVESVGFDIDLTKNYVLLRMSGELTPLYQPVSGLHIDWPSFHVDELGIDSSGNIQFKGGWVDLPNQASFSLYGFTVEITRIGFGRQDDGRDWLGFAAAVTLVDGFKAGASVDGLRILWKGSDVSLALEGIGVDLEIPDAVTVKGKVSLREQEFTGAVSLQLPSINFAIDGQFVAGSRANAGGSSYKYLAVYLDCELPVGIPLGATGVGLYGMSGLFAKNMRSNKQSNERWYQNADLSNGWYLKEPKGAAELDKWTGNLGSYGFGAGITLGTYPDNGFMLNGRLLLVLVFPGPVIIIEGKANLFKQRAALQGDEDPMFLALAILDPQSSFVFDLDARYQYRSGGELLDMHGGTEAYFYFNDASKWHLWIGIKRDRKRMIGARAFQLFDVGAYFMLDSSKLDVGVGWWLDKKWGFKHVYARVSASLEGEAISW